MPQLQSVGKRIKEYTATAINTDGEVYKKIFATADSDVEKQGAIEKQLNDLFEFLERYREPNIFEHEGKHGLKSLNFFSGLKKNASESLIEFIVKYKAMMVRKDGELDTVWGTDHNIEHALQFFFGHENCFVMRFTNDQDKNVLSDKFTSDKWLIDNKEITKTTASLTEDAALVNIKAIALKENMQLKTKFPVTLGEGLYSLHFFIRGQQEDDDGKRSGEVEVTINDVFKKTYVCDGNWINVQEYIYLEEGDYTVAFSSAKALDIDFICLFPAVKYPSMSILIGNGGMIGRNFMFFGPGAKDVEIDENGEITKWYEPPYKGTHNKYKFWFPNADDTEAEAKKERKEKGLKFDDRRWGYWSDEMRWLDVKYMNMLLDALIPVGVKVFDIILSRRGS